jgi:hypothetical protein
MVRHVSLVERQHVMMDGTMIMMAILIVLILIVMGLTVVNIKMKQHVMTFSIIMAMAI